MAAFAEDRFAEIRVKLAWSAVFLLAYLVGREIPIPLLHGSVTEPSAASAQVLSAANVATGGNFFSPSLFSLGLGPWMGAAILWRFLFLGKIARDRRIPEETVTRARNALMVVLAVVQAISLMASYEVEELDWGPISGPLASEIVIVVALTAGALLVAWLAQRNDELGLGGVTMFILYQIVITAMSNLGTQSFDGDGHHDRMLLLVGLACLAVLVIGVFAGNAELRLHVNKVAIDSGFIGVSYLPVKLNPAGASPIMYALALLAIPQYVVHAVGQVFPAAEAPADRFLAAWGLSTPLGFTAYLVLLFALSIFFGLFTVSPRDTAERMRDAGSYFDGVPPGRPTRAYLRSRVLVLSAVAGIFLVVFTGLPLGFVGEYPEQQYLLGLPGTLMVFLGLLWLLQEEIADLMIGTRYSFTFVSGSERRAA